MDNKITKTQAETLAHFVAKHAAAPVRRAGYAGGRRRNTATSQDTYSACVRFGRGRSALVALVGGAS